jgi:hypothetical protein
MVVAESSDESMRVRVLGFVKAIANLGMENGGGMKTAFAATRSCNKPTKRVGRRAVCGGKSCPIQYRRRRRTLPEFPHVASWREVSVIGSTRSSPRPRVLRLSISPRGPDLCSLGICFRQRSKEESGRDGS